MFDSSPFYDVNATRALEMALSKSTTIQYLKSVGIKHLGEMFVMWRNKKSIHELSEDKNIPNHNKKAKLEKIEFFKRKILENSFTDTTLFGMRKNKDSPIVIIDGIHRAIGIYKAYLNDKQIEKKVCLRILLCDGENIAELDDYKLSSA